MGSVTILENHATTPLSKNNNNNNNNNNNSTTADLQAKQEQAASVQQQPQRGRPVLQPTAAGAPIVRRRRRYQRQTVLHQHPNGDVSDERQIMSTGKRLAKRSIIGTRVSAPGDDGKYYSGAISNVITPASEQQQDQGGLHITPYTRYTVKFDLVPDCRTPDSRHEYTARDLIGPGFGNVADARLVKGQRVYLTHNGREIQAAIKALNELQDEVVVECVQPGQEGMSLTKRIEDIRLLESRKSARLADSDTDFARLADMGTDRKRASSNSIDVPQVVGSRKRRPSSSNDSDRSCNGYNDSGTAAQRLNGCGQNGCMDECSAAMVLMSLSTPPKNPLPIHCQQMYGSWDSSNGRVAPVGSPGVNGCITSPSSSSSASWRSGTPSPPLSDEGPLTGSTAADQRNPAIIYQHYQTGPRHNNNSSSCSPDGFVTNDEDFDTDWDQLERPRKKKFRSKANDHAPDSSPGGSYNSEPECAYAVVNGITRKILHILKCGWRDEETRVRCNFYNFDYDAIKKHLDQKHFKGKRTCEGEEDFYIEEDIIYEPACSLPTQSHWDMVKPLCEDPEYQKQNHQQTVAPIQYIPQHIAVPNSQRVIINDTYIPPSNVTAKQMKPGQTKTIPAYDSSNISVVTVSLGKLAHSPRRVRGETKKCRKVYGMEHKDLWCTQCKWKKACTRFSD